MNSLHLFAGIGGGILADKILGHTIVGAVEIEPYCRAVLKQRQEEGYLEPFPIFDDIRTFNGNEIRERIDLVCGGFPCQDISTAGRGAGIDGKKSSLFYELIRVCRTCRPRYIFLENSPAITGRGLGACLNEIAKIGYDAEWTDLSAGICGAPHLRNRWWCLCKRQQDDFLPDAESCGHALYERENRAEGRSFLSTPNVGAGQYGDSVRERGTSSRNRDDSVSGGTRNTADADGERLRRPSDRTADETQRTWAADTRFNGGTLEESQRLSGDQKEDGARQIPDAKSLGRQSFNGADRSYTSTEAPFSWAIGGSAGIGAGKVLDSDAMGREQSGRKLCQSTEAPFSWAIGGSADVGTGWWEIEPPLGRVAHGVPHRVDSLKGLGNAQVPVVAALAFLLLMERFCEE